MPPCNGKCTWNICSSSENRIPNTDVGGREVSIVRKLSVAVTRCDGEIGISDKRVRF